uniref:Cation transporter n=1 Tax=Thermofilum pendens TaxID=2269 RepID=A0A7C4BB17_THEPE
MRRARLKVAGVGCGSCVAPSKQHFIRVAGVLGVHVLGSTVEVIYDESMVSLRELLEKSGVEKYYVVKVLSDEPLGSRNAEARPALRLEGLGREPR